MDEGLKLGKSEHTLIGNDHSDGPNDQYFNEPSYGPGVICAIGPI
jgi:hypothetical protein